MPRLLLFTCLAAVIPASGATFTVNSKADTVDAIPGNAACADATGKCSLRAAVMEANANQNFDTIVIPNGVYVLSLGQLAVTSPATIRGSSVTGTIVDGAGKYRVFNVAAGKVVQLRTLTVRNGFVEDTCGQNCLYTGEYGGGIRNAGTLTLNTVIVTGCRTLLNKVSQGGFGGGIANFGVLNIQGSQITNNKTTGSQWDSYGAGIYNHIGAKLTMTRTTVSGNQTAVAKGGHGAGIFSRGSLDVTDSAIKDNTAGAGPQNSDAGGVGTYGGTTVLRKTTVSGNKAVNFGSTGGVGVQDEAGRPGILTLINCTVSGNYGDNNGGGINCSYGGEIAVQNSTVTRNSAGNGGGGTYINPIHTDCVFKIKNSIVAGNTAPSNPDCSRLTSLGYNLIGNTAGCAFTSGPGDRLNADPKLGPLASNGGKTQTHALLTGSLALDSGNPAKPGSGGASCEKTDQRGIARPQSGRCDIGAYERRPGTPHGPEVGDQESDTEAQP